MSYLRELREASRELEKGRKVVVAVVVRKLGSAPRDVGARMVIKEDGSTLGTLGGGTFERLVVKDALEALKNEKSAIKKYVFRREQIKEGVGTGLICGGEVEVFLDVLKPAPRLILIGAGHIAQSVAIVASASGFRVNVTDPDSNLASEEHFPMAEKIVVAEPGKWAEKLRISESDLILILYGGVEEDFEALLKALETPAKYIGLLGSRRKCMEFLKKLKERGYREEELKNRLYMPVGIDIGASSPGEIAVSIVAELISFLRGGKLGHLTLI